jgi:hypothetical protein
MQQFLKPTAGIARTWVVATELFEKLFVSVHNAMAAFDPSFRREALLTFARCLETRTGRGVVIWVSWHTSIVNPEDRGADYTVALGITRILVV